MTTEHPPATAVSTGPRSAGQDPAGRDPVGEHPGTAALRETLRRAVAEGLEPRLRAQEQAPGTPLGPAERRGVARSLLTEAADAHAAEQLGQPGSPGLVPDDVEARVIEEVLDEVFGLAGLAPLLGNTEIENININGCDRVFVRYADLCRPRHKSHYAERRIMPSVMVNVLVSDGWGGQVLGIIRAVGARPPSSDRTLQGGGNDDRPPGVEASHPDLPAPQPRPRTAGPDQSSSPGH